VRRPGTHFDGDMKLWGSGGKAHKRGSRGLCIIYLPLIRVRDPTLHLRSKEVVDIGPPKGAQLAGSQGKLNPALVFEIPKNLTWNFSRGEVRRRVAKVVQQLIFLNGQHYIV